MKTASFTLSVLHITGSYSMIRTKWIENKTKIRTSRSYLLDIVNSVSPLACSHQTSVSLELIDCVKFDLLLCFGKINTFEVVSVPKCKSVILRDTHVSFPFELFKSSCSYYQTLEHSHLSDCQLPPEKMMRVQHVQTLLTSCFHRRGCQLEGRCDTALHSPEYLKCTVACLFCQTQGEIMEVLLS